MNPEEVVGAVEATISDYDPEPPLSIRPYARLLTMLGEQLLKNERVALVELIKNAYDADAGTVDVEFERLQGRHEEAAGVQNRGARRRLRDDVRDREDRPG